MTSSTPKASQAAVTAAQEALGCRQGPNWAGVVACYSRSGFHGLWTDRGCPVAAEIADQVIGADAPAIAAGALREFAAELDWKRPEVCPCPNPDGCCGSEASCDAMQPSTRVVGAANLRARADRIEATE